MLCNLPANANRFRWELELWGVNFSEAERTRKDNDPWPVTLSSSWALIENPNVGKWTWYGDEDKRTHLLIDNQDRVRAVVKYNDLCLTHRFEVRHTEEWNEAGGRYIAEVWEGQVKIIFQTDPARLPPRDNFEDGEAHREACNFVRIAAQEIAKVWIAERYPNCDDRVTGWFSPEEDPFRPTPEAALRMVQFYMRMTNERRYLSDSDETLRARLANQVAATLQNMG